MTTQERVDLWRKYVWECFENPTDDVLDAFCEIGMTSSHDLPETIKFLLATLAEDPSERNLEVLSNGPMSNMFNHFGELQILDEIMKASDTPARRLLLYELELDE